MPLGAKGLPQHKEIPAVDQATHFYFALEQLTRHSRLNNRPTYPRHISAKNVNSQVKIGFLLVLSGCLLSACAQVKEAGRTIGHTTRDVATAIGHGTRDAAKAVGEGVKKVVKPAPEDEQ